MYPSDEWFLLAGREIPPEDFYDGYPQLENGVGMWRLLAQEFGEALAAAPGDARRVQADIVVGRMAEPLFAQLAAALKTKYPHAVLHVHAVDNHFFGGNVAVSGLLTGADMVQQLRGKLHSGVLLLPPDVLRSEGDLLLDDMDTAQLAEALGVAVRVVPKGGAGLLALALGGETVEEPV
ncbi:MAG: DUF512 domain-containing protein, partial [Oscillospiraceae bacterium]